MSLRSERFALNRRNPDLGNQAGLEVCRDQEIGGLVDIE